MTEAVRVGQVGLGYWGPNLLRNLLATPHAQVIGVADLDAQRLAEAAQGGRALWTTHDYRQLLERADVDAVVFSTPATLHAQMVREALLAGKHVLVEKPLAMNVDDAAALVALAERQQLVLM